MSLRNANSGEAFRLQRRLSGDKAAAAHGVRRWLADEFGTPTWAKNIDEFFLSSFREANGPSPFSYFGNIVERF